MRKTLLLLTATALAAWACAGVAATPAPAAGGFVNIPYATWSNEEPAYQIYPGDEIELTLPGLSGANKYLLAVRPDGRISLPVAGAEMMVAGRNISDVRAEAEQRLSHELRRPTAEMQLKPQSIKVYVGGEVGAPAAYDLIGDANALQVIMQAGGFKVGANTRHVQVVRKIAGGRLALREADLSKGLKHGDQPDLVPLARGDVIFVPRTGLANIGVAMQQFLSALPVTFSYSVNNVGR